MYKELKTTQRNSTVDRKSQLPHRMYECFSITIACTLSNSKHQFYG